MQSRSIYLIIYSIYLIIYNNEPLLIYSSTHLAPSLPPTKPSDRSNCHTRDGGTTPCRRIPMTSPHRNSLTLTDGVAILITVSGDITAPDMYTPRLHK